MRYRKVHTRMWGDERFRSLSAPPPNGQTLWVFLLTGPHTVNVPGLFSGGEAALAEALGWPLKGFREAFREISGKGMAKADWAARVVWIPRTIVHNPPESPNVVRSWRTAFDEIPECPLKLEAFRVLKGFVEGMGEGFAKAFREAFPQPSAKAMANQEQEQKQEKELSGAAAPSAPSVVLNGHRAPGRSGEATVFDMATFNGFWAVYPRRVGKGAAERAWRALRPSPELVEQIVAAVRAQVRQGALGAGDPRYVPHPSTWLNGKRWLDEPPRGETPRHLLTEAWEGQPAGKVAL